jgi:hypothetical protein
VKRVLNNPVILPIVGKELTILMILDIYNKLFDITGTIEYRITVFFIERITFNDLCAEIV